MASRLSRPAVAAARVVSSLLYQISPADPLALAEAAMAVNNNASALLLTLSALCRDREVIISRGQAVEIGEDRRLFKEAMGRIGLDVPRSGFAKTVELKTYDLRTRLTARPETARRDILLVTIDEDSIRKLEPIVGRWPWPRLVHAQLVNYLARGPAKVVGYDVLFSERDRSTFSLQDEQWTGAESDQAFVDAVAKAGNVVLAADATREEADTTDTKDTKDTADADGGSAPALAALSAYRLSGAIEDRPIVTPPFDGLARAARGLGHSFFPWDADGPLRRSVPFIRVQGRAVPSLAVGAAVVAVASLLIVRRFTRPLVDAARLVERFRGEEVIPGAGPREVLRDIRRARKVLRRKSRCTRERLPSRSLRPDPSRGVGGGLSPSKSR